MWRKYAKIGTFWKESFGKNIARNRAEMPIFRAFFGMEIMGFETKSITQKCRIYAAFNRPFGKAFGNSC